MRDAVVRGPMVLELGTWVRSCMRVFMVSRGWQQLLSTRPREGGGEGVEREGMREGG